MRADIRKSPHGRGENQSKKNHRASHVPPTFQTRSRGVILLTTLLLISASVTITTAENDISNIPTSFSPSSQSQAQQLGGPIDDATCHVEQLEEANDSQLFTILHDLKNTAFFRNFAVDLDEKCPLSWSKDEKEKHDSTTDTSASASATSSSSTTSSSASGMSSFGGAGKSSSFSSSSPFGSGKNKNPFAKPEEEEKCSGKLEDADPEETQSSCHVELGDASGIGLGDPFSASNGQSSTPLTVPPDATTTTTAKPKASSPKPEIDFDCDGGSVAEEIEDDAPPLCELTEAEATQYYENASTESTTPLHDLFSSALNALNHKLGWDSDAEKKTFMWSSTTDPVILSQDDQEACEDEAVEGRLPDTFWLDMCAHIKEGEGMKMVDLTLNPERNTGYNGTHIWNAIYEENCIDMDGSVDQPMCYEERFLYKLLSGLHASTTLSIAKNYYPPNKRKGRKTWEPNPLYFYDQFSDHPEYIRNLHFSYVVLLRALKKAYPILNKYEIRTGNIFDDETAMILLRRLLDSSILKSCSDVFTAFDETLMFREPEENILDAESKFPSEPHTEVITLQQNFKGVFHNISSILDCVQCQQCKLHGKMAMLGYGTALKILFMTNEELLASSLSRNEIVAFINTISKMSEALKDVRELTNLYWSKHVATTPVPDKLPDSATNDTSGIVTSGNPLDDAIGATAAMAKSGMIDETREEELVKLALDRDEGLLALAKHYAANLDKFFLFSQSIGSGIGSTQPDAIVVGTGLAGLAASLNILDRGGKVVIIEKEHRLGGNSNKASSGMNACCPNNSTTSDYRESFFEDTTRSAGSAAQPELIRTLVDNSAAAVTFLKDRVGVDLSLIAQLGGHSHKRTHRPKNGMVGAEIIYGMQRAVKEYEKSGQVQILTDTKVLNLLKNDDGSVIGVEVEYLSDGKGDMPTELYSPNTILATGGFAADRTKDSYLSKYRPELMKMAATAGSFSTGDGIGLGTDVGAGLVDMDKVQVHPTGWVDPMDPSNPNKVLAAELMRGVGGLLINGKGERFCNELGTRAYVTGMMLSHDPYYKDNKVWNKQNEIPTFALVLSSSAAAEGKKHVDHYTHKGLLNKLIGLPALAEWMGQDVDILRNTLLKYRSDASNGSDQWGKSSFQGKPSEDIENETFYAGIVTPVLHYCMGGITIDPDGQVLDETSKPIPGLHAAGEVTGGVHGNNRLGGNSLLECTVYGSIVGQKIPIQSAPRISSSRMTDSNQAPTTKTYDIIAKQTLSKHSTQDDCWVAIHGHVYDLTSFAEEHPAGAESIHKLCGMDGTEAFQSVHNQKMMEDFEEDKVGFFTEI